MARAQAPVLVLAFHLVWTLLVQLAQGLLGILSPTPKGAGSTGTHGWVQPYTGAGSTGTHGVSRITRVLGVQVHMTVSSHTWELGLELRSSLVPKALYLLNHLNLKCAF